MSPEESSPDAVVALLLDDLPPPRLGTLLRAARKQRGLTRREVAFRVGTTPVNLRRYERGDAPVPADIIAPLAECYGEDLTAQLASRVPPRVEARQLVLGTEIRTLESDSVDDVLTQYVDIVGRLRRSEPGEPIELRADDLFALSSALELSTETVEDRITELLGCTRQEAHSLHVQVLRRRLLLPVAGLAASVAVVAGIGVAANAGGTPAHHIQVAPASGASLVGAVAPATSAAPSTPTTRGSATDYPAGPAPAPHAIPNPTPTTAAPPEQPPEAAAPPVVTPDTTPMSIPANETVTIIATPKSAP